jgi:uncharacterized SAM-binding protein YcdF (DUF218 family)
MANRKEALMPTPTVPRKRATEILLAAIIAVPFLAGFGRVSILREIASFLIVEDSLEPAAAIVSLGGDGTPPFREIEAARLYRAGWAPQVVIVRGAHRQDLQSLQARGNETTKQPYELSRETLIREGVRASDIILIKDNAHNTFEELQDVFRALSAKESPVILVTSKYHTRRTRLTWNQVSRGRSRAIVRAADRDSFDAIPWPQERVVVLAVVREYLAVINAYAGFPISGWADLNRSR